MNELMKYPNSGKTYERMSSHDTARRGMSLEHDINMACQYYLANESANIHKKPTPITVVNVEYPSRNKAKITEAYFKVPSTTDYNGIYRGRYIDFEAKECRSKTSFPFTSIHAHQIKHLKSVNKHGAIAFIIIRMVHYDMDYLIPFTDFIDFFETTKRRSLPYSWIREKGHLIKKRIMIPCDFIKTVDEVYF